MFYMCTQVKTLVVIVALNMIFVCVAPGEQDARLSLASQQDRRRGDRTLHQFQNNDGTMTFTNRPEKYKHRGDYVEVDVKYERIPLPAEYRPTSRTQPKVVTDESLRSIVSRYARIYGVDEALIYAVIRAESNFDPNAISHAGARGLMQLMPGTAAEMGVTDIFDPTQNVAGGTQYLARMLEIFRDKRLALAAYNAGPENVRRHNGIPPFKETQDYVKKVLRFEQGYGGGAVRPNLTILASRHSAHPQVRRQPAQSKNTYTVHFHSGLTQPASSVVDRDPYWHIEYGNRTYPVRKDLVKSIEKPA